MCSVHVCMAPGSLFIVMDIHVCWKFRRGHVSSLITPQCAESVVYSDWWIGVTLHVLSYFIGRLLEKWHCKNDAWFWFMFLWSPSYIRTYVLNNLIHFTKYFSRVSSLFFVCVLIRMASKVVNPWYARSVHDGKLTLSGIFLYFNGQTYEWFENSLQFWECYVC